MKSVHVLLLFLLYFITINSVFSEWFHISSEFESGCKPADDGFKCNDLESVFSINAKEDYIINIESDLVGTVMSSAKEIGSNLIIHGNKHKIDASEKGKIINIKAPIIEISNLEMLNGMSNDTGGLASFQVSKNISLRGIAFIGSKVTASNASSTACGGSVFVRLGCSAGLNMENIKFSDSEASSDFSMAYGGAICIHSDGSGDIVVKGSSFDNVLVYSIDNHSYGGAVFILSGDSNVHLENCIFIETGSTSYGTGSEKSLSGGGGIAIFSESSEISIINCNFNGTNVLSDYACYGGAVYISGNPSKVNLHFTDFADNKLVSSFHGAEGGVLYMKNSNKTDFHIKGVTMTKTFSGDELQGGSVIYIFDSTLNVVVEMPGLQVFDMESEVPVIRLVGSILSFQSEPSPHRLIYFEVPGVADGPIILNQIGGKPPKFDANNKIHYSIKKFCNFANKSILLFNTMDDSHDNADSMFFNFDGPDFYRGLVEYSYEKRRGYVKAFIHFP